MNVLDSLKVAGVAFNSLCGFLYTCKHVSQEKNECMFDEVFANA